MLFIVNDSSLFIVIIVIIYKFSGLVLPGGKKSLTLHQFSKDVHNKLHRIPMSAKESQRISTFGSRLTAIVSVTLVVLLLGAASMIALCTHSAGAGLRGSVGFTIRLAPDCSESALASLGGVLDADGGVASARYISADSILAFETSQLGALELGEGVNPYCAEIEVKVQPHSACTDSIAAMTEAYGSMEGVEEIIAPMEVIAGLEHTLDRIRTVLAVLGAILLLVSVVLINNTVSLSIYSRRFSIHTMRLVGATAGFIRAPFVRAGVVNGLVASLTACALLCGLRLWAQSVEPMVADALTWETMGCLCGAAVIFGVCLCALTSFFATNRYLAKSYDEMFLK